MKEESVFTKIIKGEIPCHKVYEDERTLAFMDIHPIQPGHVLVVSKTQTDRVYELDNDDYEAVMSTVKKIAERLESVLGKKRSCVQIIGFDVPHAHVHVIPCDTVAELRVIPDVNAEPDHAALAELAKQIAF